tara:strand:- start:39 stop:515 length:477 start_codon:yes stop_codon:yes gene_type:complete
MGNFFNKKNFKGINEDSFKTFSLEGLNTYCCILSIYDGDTCTIGFKWKGEYFKTKVRMLGYDSPEMKPKLDVKNREEEKAAARRAKDFLDKSTRDKTLWIEFKKFDKYGRPLAILYTETNTYCYLCGKTRININDLMVQEGHGYAYDGGTKTKFCDRV